MIPTLLFSAPSNSGKTRLIVEIIPFFREKGLKIGYLKHHHGTFYENGAIKDTGKMIRSGAHRTVLVAQDEIVMEEKANISFDDNMLSEFIGNYFRGFDLILVEGFKRNINLPKVVILRGNHKESMDWFDKIRDDPNIIAVISENNNIQISSPCFGFSDLQGFVHFILRHFSLSKDFK